MNYEKMEEPVEEDSGYKIGLGIVLIGVICVVSSGIFSVAYFGELNLPFRVLRMRLNITVSIHN